jgi:hypothetical protein
MATIRMGVSGWTYSLWRGHFYPAELPRRACAEVLNCLRDVCLLDKMQAREDALSLMRMHQTTGGAVSLM